MKTITARERELILDAVGEGLTSLPAGVLEKDILITDVLRTIATLDIADMQLVFCGGTCLSKAHGLIERMSEDVDFKVVVPESRSRSARSKQLSELKKHLAEQFRQLGFDVPADEIIARDGNGYISFNLHYDSQFPAVASLRTQIQVELNARTPQLPTHLRPLRTMLDELIGADASTFEVSCIGIEETLAEKVLSFLRRTAEVSAGRHRMDYDDRLVRHLYDVQRIVSRHPRATDTLPPELFCAMVHADALQYRNQYPEFEQDPLGQLRGALVTLQTDAHFAQDYASFVDELVFGEPVAFTVARDVFSELAERFFVGLESGLDGHVSRA